MTKRVNVLIVEPSDIIRSGLISILQRPPRLNIEFAELSDVTSVVDSVRRLRPDVVIVNPSYMGALTPKSLRDHSASLRVVALQSSLVDRTMLSSYDDSISIYDDADTVRAMLSRVVDSEDSVEPRSELSAREKEIVVCIAKGLSNKEIADVLSLSTHTVVSHRRNITSKLEIYSASGLTIYAIVNNLISVDSIPAK